LGEGGSSEREAALKESELLSRSGVVPVFKERFLRASNHLFPSRVKFLIKKVIGGKEAKGLPETRVLELPDPRVVTLVILFPSSTCLSGEKDQSFWQDSFVAPVGCVIAQFVLGCKGKVNGDKLTKQETFLSMSPQQEVSFYLGW